MPITRKSELAAERSDRFWASYQVWDSVITWAYAVCVGFIVVLLILQATLDWSTRTSVNSMLGLTSVTILIYGVNAVRLKCRWWAKIFVYTFIVVPAIAQLLLACWLMTHWPAYL